LGANDDSPVVNLYRVYTVKARLCDVTELKVW